MKDRLITFALALGALAAFYALLNPNPPTSAERPTRPLSIEPGPNGYLALTRWLETARVPTVSLRQRYGGLKEVLEGRARDGNLLITTVPHIYPVRSTETEELRNWIAAGNTLFVAAGLSDTPDWSMGEGADPQLREHLRAMTGLKFVQVGEDDKEPNPNDAEHGAPENQQDKEPRQASLREILAANQKLPTATVTELVPIGSHPLLAGVTELEALSEYPSATWRARSDELDLVLTLAEDSAMAEPALWLARFGDGQVVVSPYGSILTNKQLGKRDNARFLANLVRWSVAPNGRVILDDAHQGLVAFYDPQAFYGDARLHKTLWWLLGLWFVFVLGSQRLRQAASSWQPVDVTSFVRATGGFLARVLRPATAAQRLFVNFFDEVARHTGTAADSVLVWNWLGTRTSVAPRDVTELKELHATAVQGRRVDPVRVQTLLAQVRERLK